MFMIASPIPRLKFRANDLIVVDDDLTSEVFMGESLFVEFLREPTVVLLLIIRNVLTMFHLRHVYPEPLSRGRTFSDIVPPIASAAVAAGDGALTTCRIPGCSSK